MALPASGEPLKLADGTLVYPGGKTVKPQREPQMVEVPSNTKAQRLVAATRRKLVDLPAVPKQMNIMSVVIMYTLLGIQDHEIALATELTVDQIKLIKEHEIYGRLMEDVATNIIAQDTNELQTIIASHAKAAVGKIVEHLDNEDGKTSLGAAKDLLDRAGYRPADQVEHRHTMEGGLVIRVIKRDENMKFPGLTLEHGAI